MNSTSCVPLLNSGRAFEDSETTMGYVKAIAGRSSVRSYDGRAVPDDEMDAILTAGGAAPVGMGRFETVHLTVVRDAEMLKRIGSGISEVMAKAMGRENKGPFDLYGASTLVIVSSEPASLPGIDYVNAGGVAENMMLQAAEDGIGSCIIWATGSAVDGDEGLGSSLGIPAGFHALFGVVFGYAAKAPAPKDMSEPRIGSNRV